MQSEPGLTIAFISKHSGHPTSINFEKFGTKYWDDDKYGSSKLGYYFMYYYKKQAVIIHKINKILDTKERPAAMEWEADRQILCLSPVLKRYDWEEWINGIGKGCPYSNDYGSTRTTSWTFSELKSKFSSFNYVKFMETVDIKCEVPILMSKLLNPEVFEDEEVIFERERRLRQEKQDEEDKQVLMKIRERKLRQNIQTLREESIKSIYNKNVELQKQIDSLLAEQDKNKKEIYIILKGERDDKIISEEIKKLYNI